MSWTSAAWKTVFWTNLANVVFTPTSPKAVAKRQMAAEAYKKEVEEARRRLEARKAARVFTPRSLPVPRWEKVLAPSREERLEAVRAYCSGIPPT